ncbi:MAG: DUF1232 domain-containing protein [Candidatus Glassbacteria bacterium]|nr:DUF1232 domain-containing protein [Candidatus Glassbacteria bacterium]
MPSDELSQGGKAPCFYDTLKARLLGWTGKKPGSCTRKLAELALLVPDITVLLGRILLDRRVSRNLRIKIGIVFTYIFSPLDLLPETLVGPVGLLDDLVLIAFALNRVCTYVDEEILLEHWPGRPEQLEVLKDLSDIAGGIFGGRLIERLADWYEKQSGSESESDYQGEPRVGLVSGEEASEEEQVERFRAAGL